jgi:hypothetical protein
MRHDSVVGKKLGALSGVMDGKGKGGVGHQVVAFIIPHMAALSTLSVSQRTALTMGEAAYLEARRRRRLAYV